MSHQVYLRGRARRKVRIGKDIPANPPYGGTGTPGNYSTSSNANQATSPYVDFYQPGLVDLDDKQAARYLNQKWGDFWTVPHFEFNIKQYGTAAVSTTNSGLVLRAPKDLVVSDVTVTTGVAPANGTITVDIKQVASPTASAGSSIFASGSAPAIVPGSVVSYVGGTASIPPSGTANAAAGGTSLLNCNWAQGTFLRVEISGVGSAPTGNNINVRIGGSLPFYHTAQSWEVGDGAFLDSNPPPTNNPFFTD